MKKLLTITAAFAFAALAHLAHAQTFPVTYTTTAPFPCSAVGHYPVTGASQIGCGGIPISTATDYSDAELGCFYYHNSSCLATESFSLSSNEVSLSLTDGALTFTNQKLSLTQFTLPTGCTSTPSTPCSSPGTIAFDWSFTDANGVAHSGSNSISWDSRNLCGGRSCWVHPWLISQTVTVNN